MFPRILNRGTDVSGRKESEAGLELSRPKSALFLHIPKTAGTSIINTVAPYYGKSLISHGDYSGKLPAEITDISFVSGHFGYSYARPLMASRVSFTFLREPRERVLSFYYFCRTRDPEEWPIYALAQKLDLEDFLRMAFQDASVKSSIWNSQVWQLAHGWANLDKRNITLWEPEELLRQALKHLDDFSYIGLTETFDQDRDVILSLLGIPRPKRSVAANRSNGRPGLGELNPRITDIVDELTQLDQRLYDEVISRRSAAPAVQAEASDRACSLNDEREP